MLIRFWKLLLVASAIVGISTLHIVSVNILQYPLSLLNVVMLFSILVLFIFETGLVVWTSAAAFFILDLYTTVTPFGVTFFAGSLSILAAYWLHTTIFTNRSWYAAGSLTLIALAVYRSAYVVALFFLERTTALDVRWSDMMISMLWEAGQTAFVVSISILILSRFIRTLRTKAIDDNLFVIRRN